MIHATSSPIDYTKYNILLVDDTPNNLDVLVDFLQAYGFGLRIALSGESAVQRVSYDAPDIILLDVLLPGIDGFETCRQLKADPTTRHIPIIFMTSLANAEDKVRGFEVGAVDYVTKPLQQAEVLARITAHLRQRDLAQDLQAQNEQLRNSSQIEKERLLGAVDEQRSQLRTLATRLTDIQEQERRNLSRELHDEMGQALTAIRMNLAAIEKELAGSGSTRIHERLTEAAQLTDETLEQIRELSLELRPSMLDDLGLVPTLQWYVGRFAKRMNVPVDFRVEGFEVRPRLSPMLETALYRILQEALTNIARHASATRVRLTLSVETSEDNAVDSRTSEVVATIEDDGCGFDIDEILGKTHTPKYSAFQHNRNHSRNDGGESRENAGAGLLGIRERVTLLDGSWQINSSPGAGTMLLIRLPLEQPSFLYPHSSTIHENYVPVSKLIPNAPTPPESHMKSNP